MVASLEIHSLPPPKFDYDGKIPKFCCARKQLAVTNGPEKLGRLAQVFIKHGMYEEFGLYMTHRHFTMSEDEVLVESVSKDGRVSVAFPWKLEKDGWVKPDKSSDHWGQYGLLEGDVVIPQTWLFDNSGSLVPYEFMGIEGNPHQYPPPMGEFASDVFEALKELGLQNIFGIKRLGSIRSIPTYEVNPSGERVSITGHGDLPLPFSLGVEKEGMFKVLWYFQGNGDIVNASDCYRCGYCVFCS